MGSRVGPTQAQVAVSAMVAVNGTLRRPISALVLLRGVHFLVVPRLVSFVVRRGSSERVKGKLEKKKVLGGSPRRLPGDFREVREHYPMLRNRACGPASGRI